MDVFRFVNGRSHLSNPIIAFARPRAAVPAVSNRAWKGGGEFLTIDGDAVHRHAEVPVTVHRDGLPLHPNLNDLIVACRRIQASAMAASVAPAFCVGSMPLSSFVSRIGKSTVASKTARAGRAGRRERPLRQFLIEDRAVGHPGLE